MELEKSNYEKFLDFINQPFMVAILVTLIICLFILIIYKNSQFGKKSIINQDKEIANVKQANADFKKQIEEKKQELIEEKDNYIKELGDKFVAFYKENEDFRNLVVTSLDNINNKHIKEKLEEYKNGKAKDN